MRRLALATATFLALVTGAVTPARGVGEPWYIVATVNATDQSIFVDDEGHRVAIPSKDVCEQFMNSPEFKAAVKDEFEETVRAAVGTDASIVWTCNKGQAPGQDI